MDITVDTIKELREMTSCGVIECKNALEAKLLSESLVKLESMPLDEGQNLLKAWLKDARRNLQDNQDQQYGIQCIQYYRMLKRARFVNYHH